jgi:hypothetical protein
MGALHNGSAFLLQGNGRSSILRVPTEVQTGLVTGLLLKSSVRKDLGVRISLLPPCACRSTVRTAVLYTANQGSIPCGRTTYLKGSHDSEYYFAHALL